MNRRLTTAPGALVCGLLLTAGVDTAQAERNPAEDASTAAGPAVAVADFQYFALIQDRNIFDPNRRGRASDREAREAREREPEPDRVESFTLLGTMSYEKGTFAYFGGSDASYRRTVTVRERIGEHQVLDISPAHVRLEMEGKEVLLAVGMQLERRNDGEWKLGAAIDEPGARGSSPTRRDRSADRTRSGTESPAASGSGEASSGASTGGAEDDILQRLLRKREQELGNENP